MFGDSPRPLTPNEVLGFVTFVLKRSALIFQVDGRPGRLTIDRIVRYAGLFFVNAAVSAPASPPVPPADPVPQEPPHADDEPLPSPVPA